MISTVLLATLLAPAFAHAETLPLISVGPDQKENVKQVSSDDFVAAMTQLVAIMNDSTLAALQKQIPPAATRGFEAAKKTTWMLRDVCVGVGSTFKIGLGDVWSVSVTPLVRFGFSNSTHPKMPD